MKTVLITAGSVYGSLDDNKIVSNRVRGIWALGFASKLLKTGGYHVKLLVPYTMSMEHILKFLDVAHPNLEILWHNSFENYRERCIEIAPKIDAAIMAAAVVNWIPAEPYKGKMPTAGYKPGDIIQVPFKLAPRVINEMRAVNPKMTLIGCKMLSDSSHEELIHAAMDVIRNARCHAVIANDLKDLHDKYVVMPDQSVHTFCSDFWALYEMITELIDDDHYHTEFLTTAIPVSHDMVLAAKTRFDSLVTQYRERFSPAGDDRVFGSLAVRVSGSLWLVSPREKNAMFTSDDAVYVMYPDDNEPDVIHVFNGGKATLNAPLLIRAGNHNDADIVIHLHEQLPNVPTLLYAPPGTVRDNNRELPGTKAFNILGHGFIQCMAYK
ncbi:MAG: phosphopantothenoylcysteine decarboxylase [Bacteroidales bacterium]|nr:phosphopantothenoylcysteine decarboxylase [Bacteroidales bacterium]